MNERDIQFALYHYRARIKPFPIMVSNIYLFGCWESDLIYISSTNYCTEYEIKRTLSDFKADNAKVGKHQYYSLGLGPTEFYYCCPANIIPVENVPEYAGLIYVYDEPTRDGMYIVHGNRVSVVKKSKRMNKNKLSDRQITEALRKGTSKFWSMLTHQQRNRKCNVCGLSHNKGIPTMEEEGL
jgi:hypothetical protein